MQVLRHLSLGNNMAELTRCPGGPDDLPLPPKPLEAQSWQVGLELLEMFLEVDVVGLFGGHGICIFAQYFDTLSDSNIFLNLLGELRMAMNSMMILRYCISIYVYNVYV